MTGPARPRGPSRLSQRPRRIAGLLKRLVLENWLPRWGLKSAITIGQGGRIDLRSRLLGSAPGSLRLGDGVALARCTLAARNSSAIAIGQGSHLSGCTILAEGGSSIDLGPRVRLRGVTLVASEGSHLSLGASGAAEDGVLRASGKGTVAVGGDARIGGLDLRVSNGGRMEVGEGAVLGGGRSRSSRIVVDCGSLVLGSRANIQGDVRVRFGGHMEIGSHTGIGAGTLLRCEEHIRIGEYCLLSYDVVVFDTNAHSVNWQARRERIEAGYPQGANEVVRPLTEPVEIGDDVWIGMRALILKGTRIGDRTIVGMGTTVTGEIPEDCLVVSEVARIVRRSTSAGRVQIPSDSDEGSR